MKTYTVGVDIGGTNTDAVLVDSKQRILASVKVTTTSDISIGFKTALEMLMNQARLRPDALNGIFLGTTHAINALLQRQGLYRVGVIRLAGHRPALLPSCYQWPADLKRAIWIGTETIDGGWECDGRAISPFSKEQAKRAIEKLQKQGAESLAVIGVFSSLNSEQEKAAAECARTYMPASLSCEIGGVGFIERENSTILNASLKKVMEQGFLSLQIACQDLQLKCPFFITQNDGSLMTLKEAIDYPVLTMSAGPTNSFRGGAKLAEQTQAVVVDIGGTSTDVGLVAGGFPKRSLNTSLVGGVKLNFSMPDVLSIGLGGGSCIRFQPSSIEIGPQSVAKELKIRAQSFGGDQLTLTDAAIAAERISIEQADSRLTGIQNQDAETILKLAFGKIKPLIQAMRGKALDLPVVLVGGGAALFSLKDFPSGCLIPPHFDVANAYGATLSEIAGTIDTVVSLNERQTKLDQLKEAACQAAIAKGASASCVKIADQQIIPFPYLPNQMARVMIRASGPRALDLAV